MSLTLHRHDLSSLKLCIWTCFWLHFLYTLLLYRVSRIYMLCVNVINIQFLSVKWYFLCTQRVTALKWSSLGRTSPKMCTLSHEESWDTSVEFLCIIFTQLFYFLYVALMEDEPRIFVGIWICMCLYLQIFGSTTDINHLALCACCKDESVLQYKGSFCNTELTNVFCTVHIILSHRLLVSCHPCFVLALGENYSYSCNY